MFFRPTFCANCGEKIDRTDWGLFTSRRFCPVCESEFKGQDLIPRVLVGAGLLIGVLGVGGYLKSGSISSETQLVRQPKKIIDQPVAAQQNTVREIPAVSLSPPGPAQYQMPSVAKSVDPRIQEIQKMPKVQVEPAEELYYCGARTAKGTPCKHRVKGNVRCFQHVGMEAMLAPAQLRIK